MQTKLTKEQISNCREIAKLLLDEKKTFNWSVDCDYWLGVYERLCEISKHGTSDGKPYIDPEPPIPEGYRKANADEWRRRDVKYWDPCRKDWRPRLSQGTAFDPPAMQRRYIVPIDPPLTDQDARTRPWVMVKDSDEKSWMGPYAYMAKDEREKALGSTAKYLIRHCDGSFEWFCDARRATSEEIEKAIKKP